MPQSRPTEENPRVHDSDISWQLLRGIVQKWAGTSADIAEVRHLDGGCINNTLCVTTNKDDRAVLKISPHRVNRDFEREAYQLEMMRELGLPVPKIYAQQTASLDAPDSYILMEFIEGCDLNHAKAQCDAKQFDAIQEHLAELMGRLHRKTNDDYCRVMREDCPKFQAWPQFFRAVYDPIWETAQKDSHLPTKQRKQIAKIHDKLEAHLAHDDRPRLVHWDAWSANLLAAPDANGNWRITAMLDPNCKFAHAEAEIAYMEMFHTVTPAFLKAYTAHHKLGDDYHRRRKHVYQLYDMIDHVALFGEQYVKPLLQTLERTNAAVS